jgi:hypothetical protein
MFACAGFLYFYLTNKEQEGGTFRIQWMVAIVYDIFGKWGVTGIVAGIGVISVLIGVWQFGRSRQSA